jgi:hypothetical protein
VLLLFVLIAAGGATDAAAQFKKLKKMVADKAGDAGTTAACVPNRPPTYVQTVNLSAAQMAAINAGLDAEIEAAPAAFEEADRQQKASEREARAYEKARAEYDKRNEKYQACADKVMAGDAARSEELNQRADAAGAGAAGGLTEAELEKLGERAAAAAERVSRGQGTAEDRKTLADFQSVMAGVQTSSNQAVAAQQESSDFDRQQEARVEKACGVPPVEPTAPASATLPGDKIRGAGAKKAGMSDHDYATGREELIGLAMSNAVIKPSEKISQESADAMNQAIKEAGGKICAMQKEGVPL